MFLTQLVWTLAEVAGKIFDGIQIGSDGVGRVITTLEFLQHPFSQWTHVGLLGPTPYEQFHPCWVCSRLGLPTRSVRRVSGFVQSRLSGQVPSGVEDDG